VLNNIFESTILTGRVYVCELDSLTIREIDGSQSKHSFRPGFMDNARISCVRICSYDAVVIGDGAGNVAKYGKNGKFMWTIQPLARDTCALFCLDSGDLLYCATSDPNQVKVHLLSAAFSHVLVNDLNFRAQLQLMEATTYMSVSILVHPSFQC